MNNKNKDLPFVTQPPKPDHIYLLPWNPDFFKVMGKIYATRFYCIISSSDIRFNGC